MSDEDKEVESLIDRAFKAAAQAKESQEDAEYTKFAESMKANMPPEIRKFLDNARLVKPSEISSNPILEMLKLRAEMSEMREAYNTARHVIGALMIQYGTKGPAEEYRIFLSDDAREATPNCTNMDMIEVPDGVIMSIVPHRCEITPN